MGGRGDVRDTDECTVSGKYCTEIQRGVGVELDPTSKMRVLEEYIHRVTCQKLAMRDWGTEGSGQRVSQRKGHAVGPGRGRAGRLGWSRVE